MSSEVLHNIMRLSHIPIPLVILLNILLLTLTPLCSIESNVGKKYTYDFNLTFKFNIPGENITVKSVVLNYTLTLLTIAEYNANYFLIDIVDKNDPTRYLKANFYQSKDGLILGFHVIEAHKLKWLVETLWHLVLMLSLAKFDKGIRIDIFDVFYNRLNETHGQLWNVSLTCISIDVAKRSTREIAYEVDSFLTEVSVTKVVNYRVHSLSVYKYSSISEGNVTITYSNEGIIPCEATCKFTIALFMEPYTHSIRVLSEAKLKLVRVDGQIFPLSLHPNTSYRGW